MSILCWNCRGLGKRQTVQELGDIVRAQDPTVMFLTETWLDEARLVSSRDSLQFGHYHGVSKINHGGGLALFWKKDFDLDVLSSSQNHIDMVINKDKAKAWRFTGFYGFPETHLQSQSWSLLKSIHSQSNLPWLVGGDFNEILKSHEKQGGRPRPSWQMKAFMECSLLDLGYVGKKFTWFKNCTGGVGVWERLDRVLCSTDWYDLFPVTRVQVLSAVQSDHGSLMINPEGIPVRRNRPWRFEQLWLEEEDCPEVVNRAWETRKPGSPMAMVMGKIENCQIKLSKWSKNSVCNVSKTLIGKKKELQAAEENALHGEDVNFFMQLKAEINELLSKEALAAAEPLPLATLRG